MYNMHKIGQIHGCPWSETFSGVPSTAPSWLVC